MSRLMLSFACATLVCTSLEAQTVVNPALNDPDRVSWELFVQVNTPSATAGNNNVRFETWASDDDTFTASPVWPGTTPRPSRMKPPALGQFVPKAKLTPHVVPGGGEEVRRNKATFDFIVNNKFFTQTGLKAAFAAGKSMSFPIESIEVKANWVPVGPGINPALYHVNTASDAKQYALVSMHVISKQVPNWTWATFEHKENPGRCDLIGCRDQFGATVPVVPPQTPAGGTYPACAKTPALLAMFTTARLDAVFNNYCLKGSQVDFTTSTGLSTRLGNSVTENGFVNTSSCITCHGRAAVDANAKATSQAGFLVPLEAALCPTGSPCSPSGALRPVWFWQNPGKPTQKMTALQTDFVWAIPFLAVP